MEKWKSVFEYESLISMSEVEEQKKVCNHATFTTGTQIFDTYNLKLLGVQGYNNPDYVTQIFTAKEWRKIPLKDLRKMKRVFLFMVDDSGKPKGFFKSFIKEYSKKPIQNKVKKISKNDDNSNLNNLEEIVRKVISEMNS